MATVSPILPLVRDQEPVTLVWGSGPRSAEVIASLAELELEYASLRRGCVLIDQPQRAILEAAGAETLSFLDRMLTQKLSELAVGEARPSFWLNRQGRIVADAIVFRTSDRVLIDVDALASETMRTSIERYLFAEDVQLRDGTEAWHRLALHGPEALRALAAASGGVVELEPWRGAKVTIAGAEVWALRVDATAEPGVELFVACDRAADVWRALQATGEAVRLRPAGWHAYNIARIEAGTPMFHLDFGTETLPAETSLLESRVSFSKGCYLGQEIVARLQSRGHPKQKLVGLRMVRVDADSEWQPVTGAQVLAGPERDGTGDGSDLAGSEKSSAVGAVTSATVSPMSGGEPICFAMVKWQHTEPGTRLIIRDGGYEQACVVQPQLRFWPRPSAVAIQ